MRPFPLLATLLTFAALVLYITSVSSCHWLGYTAPNTQTYIGPFRACTTQGSAGIDEESYVSNSCNAEFSNPVGTISVTDECAAYRAVRAFLIISIVLTAIALLCYYLSTFDRIPVLVPRTHGILWSLLAGLSGLIAWAIFIHIANYLGDPWVYSWGFGMTTGAWVLNWLSSIFAYIPYPYTMEEERRKLGTRFDTGLTTQTGHQTGQGAGIHAGATTGAGRHTGATTGAGVGAGVAAAGVGMMESVKHALGFGKGTGHTTSYGKHEEHERAHYPRDEEHPYTGERRTGITGTGTAGTERERGRIGADQGTAGTYGEQQRFAPSTTGGPSDYPEYEKRPVPTTSTGYGASESAYPSDTTGTTSNTGSTFGTGSTGSTYGTSNTGSSYGNVGTGATYGSGTEYRS